MSDGAQFFAKVKQKKEDAIPEGMTVHKLKRLKEQIETQTYLGRGNSIVVREPIEDRTELADLFRRGDLVKGKDLAAKLEAEEVARLEFERVLKDRQRDSRYESPRATTRDTTPIWKREQIEE